MNKPHLISDSAHGTLPARGVVQTWLRFWFTPTDPVGLHAIRLLSGLLFLFWLLSFVGHYDAFFGLQGWFDQQAYQAYADAASRPEGGGGPPITWSVVYLAGTDATLLTVIYWSSVAILVLFTLGVATRITAVLTWVVVASFTANPAISYDGDALLLVLALYLMVGYLLFGLRQPSRSWPERLLSITPAWLLGRDRNPSVAANMTLRLLQVHFAIIICVSGFHKLQLMEWWSGTSFWYALYRPFETTVEQARQHAANATFYLSILSLGAYLALAWQIGYPLFAWRRGWWRLVLLGGAVLGWLAIAFMYRLPLFGPAILIGSLCFLTTAEWRWALGLLGRIPGAQWLATEPELASEPRRRSRERERSDGLPATAARDR